MASRKWVSESVAMMKCLQERGKIFKDQVKYTALERKKTVIRQSDRIFNGMKKTGKEIVKVRNDIYFVGSGLLGSAVIYLTVKDRQDKDLCLSVNLVKVMATTSSLSDPSLRKHTLDMLLLEWNNGGFKAKLGIIKRLILVYGFRNSVANTWLSDILNLEITNYAFNKLKGKNVEQSNKLVEVVAGVFVEADCKVKFADLNKFRYILYKVDMEKIQVVVDKVGLESDRFEDFAMSIPDDECRFAVFNFDFGAVLIHWAPDSAELGSRIIYSSLKKFLKAELDWIVELEASDTGLDTWKNPCIC